MAEHFDFEEGAIQFLEMLKTKNKEASLKKSKFEDLPDNVLCLIAEFLDHSESLTLMA